MSNRHQAKNAKDSNIIIGYARKSTDESGKQEQSIQIQRDAINDFAEQNGLVVGGFFFDEGVSGSTPTEKCPGLVNAIAAIREKGAKYLLIHRSCRLSRSVTKTFEVKKIVEGFGAKVISVEDGLNLDDDTTLIKEVISSLQSQLFLNQLKRRVKEGMTKKKNLGKSYCKNAPYGFSKSDDGTLIHNEIEQEALRRMKNLHIQGYSTHAIAKILTDSGFKSRTGTCFQQMSVYRMLRKAA